MWVIASVCPTVGSQLGQIPCIFSHFCSIRPTHGNKRGSWNSFKTITPIFINYTGNMVKARDIYGSFKIIRFLSRPLLFCVFWCINLTFLVPFPRTQAKQVQTCQNSKFQIPLCQLCLLCTRVSKSDRVLKTHSNHDNSNNKIGRQFKFT